MSKNVSINISLLSNGTIACDQFRAFADRNDSIVWSCPRPFAIQFNWDGIWHGQSYSSGPTGGNVTSHPIPASTPFGKFEYVIAVLSEKSGIVTMDPEIIVRR